MAKQDAATICTLLKKLNKGLPHAAKKIKTSHNTDYKSKDFNNFNNEQLLALFNQIKQLEESSDGKKHIAALEEIKLILMRTVAANLRKKTQTAVTAEETESNSRWFVKLLSFIILAAGVFWSAADGFNDIVSMLNLVPHIPNVIFVSILGVFILSQIAIYFSFDFQNIANQLGVSIFDVKTMIDVYKEQTKTFNECTAVLNNINDASLDIISQNELRSYETMISIFNDDLQAKRSALSKRKKDTLLAKVIKYTMGFLGIVLNVGGGFFAGQSAAIFIAAAIFGITVNPLTWWVIVAATICAGAAFASFVALELSGITSLVDKMTGSPGTLDNKLVAAGNEFEHGKTKVNMLILRQNLRKQIEENQQEILRLQEKLKTREKTTFNIEKTKTIDQEIEKILSSPALFNNFDNRNDPNIETDKLNEIKDQQTLLIIALKKRIRYCKNPGNGKYPLSESELPSQTDSYDSDTDHEQSSSSTTEDLVIDYTPQGKEIFKFNTVFCRKPSCRDEEDFMAPDQLGANPHRKQS